jgi:small-conductance mechanosensitive channel
MGKSRLSDQDLSQEETNHLYELSTIPMALVFFIFLGYFVYLEDNSLLKTQLDFIFRLFLPFAFSCLESGFVAFEVLYHRRIKKPLRFQLKRLTLNSLIMLFGIALFLVFSLGLNSFLSPIVGNEEFLVSALLTLLVFSAVILTFKDVIARLYES